MRRALVSNGGAVIALLALYFTVQFAVRLSLPSGLRFDESQQAFFSQWLTWGYDSQPPLYNWIQAIVVALFGLSLATLSATKNLMLFGVYASYYTLARSLMRNKALAVVAVFSLFTMPQVVWEAQRDLTHSVIEMMMVCLTLLAAVRTIRKPSYIAYALTGVAIGLGLLTKYNYAVIAAALFIAVAAHPIGRKRILDRRIILTLAIAVLTCLPHALWVVSDIDLATGRTLGIMQQHGSESRLAAALKGPLELLWLIVLISAPTCVVLLLIARRSLLVCYKADSEWSRFLGIFLLASFTLLLMLIVGFQMTSLRDRWFVPFLFLVPLYICLKLEASGIDGNRLAMRFLPVAMIVMVLVPCALLVRVNLSGLLHSYEAYNVPYATFVRTLLAEENKAPALVLTDDWKPSGNLKLQLPKVPVMSLYFGNLRTTYDWQPDKPVLLVWEGGTTAPQWNPRLKDWIDSQLGSAYSDAPVKQMAIPYDRGDGRDSFLFDYVWLYPHPG
ncbi:hypothetical protein ASE04_08865 [Rhizobium sp. Root708]|uniref:glycosyltransferase family 39 protein n=1 Tax=Rhizobium sp. Root708 TaxID=1736592 RepID=UPI0006FCD075|nr:glycosyltransferase family 39 protein [Rhizobium sp. Root708]KRB51647.1 hypothetical protein ASE04_08865 [Rhizobium sp. Root708]